MIKCARIMNPEIFLDRIEPAGLLVATNNGGDVSVGTSFTKLAKIQLDRNSGTPTELWSKTVDLRIVEASIFRKAVEIIPHGFSAGLRFHGMGMKAVMEALASREIGHFIYLRP
jgi:hypothetical protein